MPRDPAPTSRRPSPFLTPVVLAAAWAVAGCGSRPGGGNAASPADRRVVVYSSLDREFSQPILKDFEKRTGVRVDAKFDVESTKTVGLTQRIAAEAEGGQTYCDLFWNNEIINTLRLKERGLLAPTRPASAAPYPEAFKAKDGTWHGFAARARVLVVNTKLVPEAERPRGIHDLLDPKWKGKIGIAKPLSGTTATHAVCLFSAWGDDKARAFFRGLKANGVNVLSGNKQVATATGSGAIAFGLTDTDDAMGEIAAGNPVAIVYPDRRPDELGTLFIPNTLAVLRGAPHPKEAAVLVDFLLSPAVESALAAGPGAQIPLNPDVTATPQVETPRTVHPMSVDWDRAVKLWDGVMGFLTDEFAG